MNIKIYSTPSCPWCLLAKKYFKDKNIDFVDFNVAEDDAKAQEMIDISGQTGVPVIVIERDDADPEPTVVPGFRKDDIEKALEQKK